MGREVGGGGFVGRAVGGGGFVGRGVGGLGVLAGACVAAGGCVFTGSESEPDDEFVGALTSPVFGMEGKKSRIESGTPGRTAAVPIKVRVCVGVGVRVMVLVGVAETRGVAVAVGVAVLVGRVAVGKGPNNASIVPAMAVLVPSIAN